MLAAIYKFSLLPSTTSRVLLVGFCKGIVKLLLSLLE